MALSLRASAYLAKGDFEGAIADNTKMIELAPTLYFSYVLRGAAYMFKGEYGRAREDLEKGLALKPDAPLAEIALADLLATCPVTEYRDGNRAVILATLACKGDQWESPEDMQVLAAAYAEISDFNNAILYQEKALTKLTAGQNPDILAEAKIRLQKYQDHQPFRRQPKK